jgi:hypothetical protein
MFDRVDLGLAEIEIESEDRGWTARGLAFLEGWDQNIRWEAWRSPADPAWSVVLVAEQGLDWAIADLFIEHAGLVEAVNRELDRRVAA